MLAINLAIDDMALPYRQQPAILLTLLLDTTIFSSFNDYLPRQLQSYVACVKILLTKHITEGLSVRRFAMHRCLEMNQEFHANCRK